MSAVLSLFLFLFLNPGYADPDIRKLSTATEEEPMVGWETEWADDHGEIEVALSKDRATVGDAAIKISYGPDQWRVAYLDFREREAGDWRGWDVLEFDLYNEGPHEIPYLRILVHDDTYEWARSSGKRIVGTTLNRIPAGKWLRHTISLRREPGTADPFADIDRERVGVIRFMAHANHPFPETTNLYIDNIRLRNLSGQRIQTLDKALSVLVELEDAAVAREAENMLDQLETITDQPQETPENREQISRQLSDLEDQMTAMARRVAGTRTRDYFQAISDIYVHAGLVEKSTPDLIPLDEPIIDLEEDQRVRALERISDTLAEIKIETSLQAGLQRYFADHDFAYGVPEKPNAWIDDTYSGRVSGSINLQAARNEYEPAQIVVLAHNEALRNVKLEITDLISENGSIDSGNIEIAPMGWRKRRQDPGWIADMLRPDIEHFEVEKGKHQPVWITIYVPEDTPAGNYRGTATISADNVEPQEINVALQVWPFTLPETASLPTATNCGPARTSEAFARTIIERRWNPFQLYQWGSGADPAWLNKLTDMGATMHNLLRISRHAANYGEDEDGNPVVTNKDLFFRRLDPIVEEIRENYPDLWPHVALYGFDEPSLYQALAMDEFYGELKERYHNITTLFADLYGLWESFIPENVDIWTVSRGTLTAEARDLIHEAGMDVWWWNTYSNPLDPVGVRVQYWSTLKDNLDGILQYNLNAGGGGTRESYTPWPLSLWPEEERIDGGILRRSKDEKPISTVAFEYFREGMEDVEYLYLLRERREALAELAGDEPSRQQRTLLREADRLLRIPENITTGLLGDRAVDVGEVVVETTGHTEDMNEILAARLEIAELIKAIDRELN